MEGITCFLSNTLHKQEAEVIFYLSKKYFIVIYYVVVL